MRQLFLTLNAVQSMAKNPLNHFTEHVVNITNYFIQMKQSPSISPVTTSINFTRSRKRAGNNASTTLPQKTQSPVPANGPTPNPDTVRCALRKDAENARKVLLAMMQQPETSSYASSVNGELRRGELIRTMERDKCVWGCY